MRRRLYRQDGFLEPAACPAVRGAMDRARPEPAEVLLGAATLDAAVRRASYREVDAGTLALVESRFDASRATLAAWFGRPLTAREGAGFLRYGPGGFYRTHRDRGDDPSWPAAARRLVAVVLFLNADFSGGVLRLVENRRRGVDVLPRAGTLVAFPADTLHEVTPVTDGTRDVVVDWFY